MVMPEVHGRRDDREGPPTYRDPSFSELIARAAGLEPTGLSLRVADVMSRHGKMAAELRAIAPQHSFTALALTDAQLSSTPEGISIVTADTRSLDPLVVGTFDRVVVRYGIKEFTEADQAAALSSLYRITKENGIATIADMVADEETKDWLNEHHRQKQRFEGRNIDRDGECNIPTEAEWMTSLSEAGFRPEVSAMYTSKVTTTDWVKGKQITDEQRVEMDRMLLQAPDVARDAFNIREENGLVKVDYPVIIIRAVKPVVLLKNE